MWLAISELWTFTHQNDLKSSEIHTDLRAARAREAAALGLETETAILACIGTKRKRTYAHDMVYGLPKLYMLFGKPYLSATEGNESAHQQMKVMFKTMCSKSSKKNPAVLQCMNLMSEHRLLVDEARSELPRQKRTQSMTGLETGSGRKAKELKCSDLTCEDMKENMTALITHKHRRAHTQTMDQKWVVACECAKGGGETGETAKNNTAPECEEADMDADE